MVRTSRPMLRFHCCGEKGWGGGREGGREGEWGGKKEESADSSWT